MTRSSIASIHALCKVIAFFAADALRLTEPRSFGCGFAAPWTVAIASLNPVQTAWRAIPPPQRPA